MRAVFDTNVLVSALMFGGIPFELLRLAEAGVFDIVASEETMAELKEVISRGKFADRLKSLGATPDDAIRGLQSLMVFVVPEPIDGICRDQDDDIFISTAVAGQADVIVSGDMDLLSCSDCSPLPVVKAAEFLTLIRESAGEELDGEG